MIFVVVGDTNSSRLKACEFRAAICPSVCSLWEGRENFSRVFLWKTGGIRAWQYGFLWFMVLPVLPPLFVGSCTPRGAAAPQQICPWVAASWSFPWAGHLNIGGAVGVDGELKFYLANNKHRCQNVNMIYKNTFLTGSTYIMRLQTKINSRNNIPPFLRKVGSTTSLTQN